MRFFLPVLLFCASLTAHAASEVSSSVFVLDLAYVPVETVWEETAETVALSTRFALRTVVEIVDSDGDGLPDWWELAHGFDPHTADADADADGDGFSNLEEYNAGTDPRKPDIFANSMAESLAFTADLSPPYQDPFEFGEPSEVWYLSARFLTDTIGISPDTDGDGMRDDWESAHGLNPLVPDGHLDSDGDGRTNLEEYNARTHPLIADNWKLSMLHSERFVTDTHISCKLNSLPLVEETYVIFLQGKAFICDTGGLYYDWDGDGIPNWWESRFTTSKVGLWVDEDLDGDGYSNFEEFVAYTVPTNCESVFAITRIDARAGQHVPSAASPTTLAAQPAIREMTDAGPSLALSWPSAIGRRYHLYATDDLRDWPSEPSVTVSGNGAVLTVDVSQSASTQFYRVTVELANPSQ